MSEDNSEYDVSRIAADVSALSSRVSALEAGSGDLSDLKDLVAQLVAFVASSAGVVITTQAHKDALAASINVGLPTVASKADYDALPAGANYLDPLGIRRTK